MRNSAILVWLAALALGACGGGGNADGSSFASSSTASTAAAVGVAAVVLSADTMTIPADGSAVANITALVKDANNNAVRDVPVQFVSNGKSSLVVGQGTTDPTGVAKATLSAVGAAAGSTINVTAAAGTVNATLNIAVTNTQRTITVVTSLPQIPSDASKSAIITALVRDASNNVVTGAPVSFQSDSGSLTVSSAQTDNTGTAKATLNAGTDPTNRKITVTVSSGTATATVQVDVTGTNLTVSGPTNLVLGSTGSYTALLTNSAGQGIPAATVTVASSKGNTIVQPAKTDANGRATFNLTATSTSGGTDTITAISLGIQATTSTTVSTQTFTVTAPANNVKVNLGNTQTVTVNWKNGGTPVQFQPVTFAATRGTLSSATPVLTDASGNASVTISSTSAGPSIVSASGAGVSAQVAISFVAIAPSQVAVQAGPASVPVGGTSAITAIVRDAANNLVEGATINFQVQTDPTNGGLNAASVVTNAQGVAQVQYTAGNTSSGANGVTVVATVNGTAISGSTSLTVGGQTVFLSLGTGNTIDVTKGPAVYQITYSVFAVDAGGAALANVPITLKILPVAYGKGVLAGCPGGQYWGAAYSTLTSDPASYNGQRMCKNEDTDYTGNINSLGIVGGIPVKDYNTSGKLEPGNIPVVAPSSGVTDANGRLDVTVTYPRDHAYWVEVSLVASTTVQGTESNATSTFILQGALGDYACAVGPPGPVSPYGTGTTCADPK